MKGSTRKTKSKKKRMKEENTHLRRSMANIVCVCVFAGECIARQLQNEPHIKFTTMTAPDDGTESKRKKKLFHLKKLQNKYRVENRDEQRVQNTQ